jgi:hypothetical protein
MATLTVTDEQVLELALQLPPGRRRQLLTELLRRSWPEWEKQAAYAEDRFRQTVAERGKNWEAMTEEDKDDFISELVHEDRQYSR